MLFEIINALYCFKYKKFTENNVNKWIERYKRPSDKLSKKTKRVISHYCKEDSPKINIFLRENKQLNEKENNYRTILDQALSNEIDENIIAYRKVKKILFKIRRFL